MTSLARRLVPVRLLTRSCRGRCGDGDFHSHHLTRMGRWYFRSFA